MSAPAQTETGVPFHCKGCGRELGYTTEGQIVLRCSSRPVIFFEIKFRCWKRRCGTWNRWTPLRAPSVLSVAEAAPVQALQ